MNYWKGLGVRVGQRQWVWFSLSLLAAVLLAGEASARPERLLAPVARKIERDVAAALRRYEVPGAAVMVIRGGRVVFAKGFGVLDTDRRRPVRAQSLFEIGSITKQFTDAAILQLQEAGKLQIDRPLSDYLPDAPHAREVTLRQLMAHTAGLPDYITDAHGDVDPAASKPATYEQLVARVAGRPLDFAPGSRWAYSNTGYLLLGRVIETVSGESYETYVRRHLLEPLGMADTHTVADEDHLADMARGYRHVGGRLERAPAIDASWAGAAGFLVAPMPDLARWDAGLRAGKVVSPDSYRQMTTPFVLTTGERADYGLGLFVNPVYGQPRIGHTGGTNGFTAADEYFPDQDLRIIAFTNLGDSRPEPGETLTNLVFADLYPAIAAKAFRPAPGENRAVTRTVREAFRELQTGKAYSRFAGKLAGRLAGGAGSRFVDALGAYGTPSAAVFKGVRREGQETWRDYLIRFGPGAWIPFSARIDAQGAVAGFSVG